MVQVVILSLARLTEDSEGECAVPFRLSDQSGSVLDQGILSSKRIKRITISRDSRGNTKPLAGATRSPSALTYLTLELIRRDGTSTSCRIPLIGQFVTHTVDLVPDGFRAGSGGLRQMSTCRNGRGLALSTPARMTFGVDSGRGA